MSTWGDPGQATLTLAGLQPFTSHRKPDVWFTVTQECQYTSNYQAVFRKYTDKFRYFENNLNKSSEEFKVT